MQSAPCVFTFEFAQGLSRKWFWFQAYSLGISPQLLHKANKKGNIVVFPFR